jgi:integrase
MNNLIYSGNPRRRPLPEVFSENELKQIFKQLSICKDYLKSDWGEFQRQRDITLIATIYILALRPGEACNLKFNDFNMRNATVKIRWQSNKTKSERVLPVPSTLLNVLRNYLSLPRARFWHGSPYLFPSMENPHISPGRLKHIFREKALKPCGLWLMPTSGKTPKIRLYTLRHSRATHILNKQIQQIGSPDIFAIANILGHKDIRSTTVYLHQNTKYREYLREQIEL